ncbi:MAG: NADH-quinone oxidoreductase subunit NuoE [Geminicoccaceae bacterium]|nr:NADH-quinone oxidoreductase subunit NuoE [Geminicoccaceae bacterium]
MAPDVAEFAFSEANRPEVERILKRYPEGRKASAVIPLLHLAQAQHGGWLPKAVLDHVADMLSMPKIRVYEVASFYDMFNMEPTGRCQLRVCTTTPCWLRGSDDVVRACEEGLGIAVGENTPDGRFFLREFECLGACANAPVLWIDDHFYEDLDYEGTRRLVEALKRGETPKPGPQNGRFGSMALGGKTTLHDVPERAGQDDGEVAEGDHARDQAPVEKAKPADPDAQTESPALVANDAVPNVKGDHGGDARTEAGANRPLRGDEEAKTIERRDEG